MYALKTYNKQYPRRRRLALTCGVQIHMQEHMLQKHKGTHTLTAYSYYRGVVTFSKYISVDRVHANT